MYCLLLLVVAFVSDFQVFAFYHVLLSVIPTPWNSHGGACLVLLLNLVLLTVPSRGYVQFLELLVSTGCRCYGSLAFFKHTSWCSCLLFQLHLWWLVWPLPSHSIWRSTYLLIFSVAFFWMLSSLEWPHLWFGTYQTSSPVWLCLVCCRGHVC